MARQSDPRNEARRRVVSAFFNDTFNEDAKENVTLYEDEISQNQYDTTLFTTLFNGIRDNIEVIDDVIRNAATEWPISKIAKIDLVILRIAVFELLYSKDTPAKVAVDEAVELAKSFGSDNSSKFINGVLGSIIEKYPPKNKIFN